MTNIVETLSYENPVFRAYIFWSSILVLKMMAMAYLTGRQRHKNKVFPNREDAKYVDAKAKPSFGNEDVERVRRAHRNDLENCLPFMAVGFFFVLTNPEAFLAINLFRAAVVARIIHTIAYAIFSTQPARGISWAVCYFITIYMAVRTAIFFL